uniref:Uncharacterized protein n=1 Tax=Nelumbo nucifera TaxID=4432 RepID=A0A822Y903_NELNU|nr:TPA_asm: hypothetical protein HUJ06_009395 [Nelumbo nucifera]
MENFLVHNSSISDNPDSNKRRHGLNIYWFGVLTAGSHGTFIFFLDHVSILGKNAGIVILLLKHMK